jgi:hypothetical protein
VNSLRIALTLAAGLAAGHGLAGGTAAPLAQQGSGIPSPSGAETTGTGAPTVRPQPDVHGRAGSGESQQHGSDSASPGSSGGGVSPSDPAGSGPTMNESGAPPATGGAQSPASTGQ